MSNHHQDFEQRIKASLDESAANVDANTRRKLAAIRRQAMAQEKPGFAWLQQHLWAPAAAVAFSAVLAFALYFHAMVDRPAEMLAMQEDQAAMLEMMTGDDELEADPAFYVWVDEELSAEGPGNAS